jgi:hypothetical protein
VLSWVVVRLQQPTEYACFFCLIAGVVMAWRGKTLYGQMWRHLPVDHPDRELARHLNYKRPGDVGAAAEPPAADAGPGAARTTSELRPNYVLVADQANEKAKQCVFWQLPYFDPMSMASYDGMHTVGGLVKGLFSVIGGEFSLGSPAQSYEDQVNK